MTPQQKGLEITGADRVSFLHNILTQDIKSLKPGQKSAAALLSSTAKVLALMKVFALEDRIVLTTESGYEEKLAGLLDKYVITEDVQIQIADSKFEAWVPAELNEVQRIEQGILRYGVDVTEEVSLPETGLDGILASETKGCYPGQEVVARTNTYKGLQRKMVGLVWGTVPKGDCPLLGDKIYAGDKEIGWITSACVSPALGGIALGYVSKGFFEKSGEVEIKTKTGGIKARTTALPFQPRSG